MRIDRNFLKFTEHDEWYISEVGHMYIPTDKCPEEAKEAMDRYNSYTFPKEYAASKKMNKA